MPNALIDNGTLYSMQQLIKWPGGKSGNWESSIQSLNAFLEAYVLNDKLIVDEKAWLYILDVLPQVNHNQFRKVVQLQDLKLNPIHEIDTFLESEIIFWILKMFIENMREMSFFNSWLSYGRESRAKNQEAYDKIEKKIYLLRPPSETFRSTIDLDAILLAYRTINYISFAEERRLNLIANELREFFISSIGIAYGLAIPQQTNHLVYKKTIKEIESIRQRNYVKDILTDVDQGKIVWKSLNTPFLPAVIYEKSESVAEMFMVAETLRSDFKCYREIMNELSESWEQNEFGTADKILTEMNEFFRDVSSRLQAPSVEWSFSLGFPISVSLGLAKKATAPKYLKVFSRFLNRYSLPESYSKSCKRLFQLSDWNESSHR